IDANYSCRNHTGVGSQIGLEPQLCNLFINPVCLFLEATAHRRDQAPPSGIAGCFVPANQLLCLLAFLCKMPLQQTYHQADTICVLAPLGFNEMAKAFIQLCAALVLQCRSMVRVDLVCGSQPIAAFESCSVD